jgi:hypothetical protein
MSWLHTRGAVPRFPQLRRQCSFEHRRPRPTLSYCGVPNRLAIPALIVVVAVGILCLLLREQLIDAWNWLLSFLIYVTRT